MSIFWENSMLQAKLAYYQSNPFSGLGLEEIDALLSSDDEEEDEDLLTLQKHQQDLEVGHNSSLEWQEVGVMHKIGPRRIIEQRTFAYDDLIRGSTMKSMCRLKDFCCLHDKTQVAVRELEFETGGVGFKVWDASVVLMDWLHTNVGEIEQKNVVELGAGCGLAGIFAVDHANSVLLSDSDETLVENLLTSVVMNKGEAQSTQYFPTQVLELDVEATALLKPRVSLQFEDGKIATLCMLDYSQVGSRGIRDDTVAHFDFVFGSDITYSEQMGLTVARACYSLLKPLGRAVVVSPNERVGHLDCLLEFMRLGIVVSVQEVVHQREMTSAAIAERMLGRKPKICIRTTIVILFSKSGPAHAIGWHCGGAEEEGQQIG